jgi:hypothetical protein
VNYRVEINGFTVIADSVEAVLALVGHETVAPPPDWRTLPRKKKAPVAEPAKPVGRPRTFKKLTDEERAAAPATKPLICRKPLGCGKAFESENRQAWYCIPCTAKRDEGRPV